MHVLILFFSFPPPPHTDVTYGCRDNGFRAGATPNAPPVGWMESKPVEKSIQQVTITIKDVNEPPFFTTILGSSGKFELEVNELSELLAITENFEQFITCKDVDAAATGGGDTTNDVELVLKTSDNGISSKFIIEKGSCEPGENLGNSYNCPSDGKRPWCVGAVIRPKDGWLPDFETQQIYDFIITASDKGGLSVDLPVRITVRDQNDKPEIVTSITPTEWSVKENAPPGFVVGNFSLTDADIDGIVVTWRESPAPWDAIESTIESGNTGTAFELVVVSGTGTAKNPQVVELRYRGEQAVGSAEYGLDFERQKQYTLVVRVTDSGGPQTVMSTEAKPDASNPLRPAWVKTSLYSEFTQIINVLDVDDVTVEDVFVQINDANKNDVTKMLSTAGGEKVRIVGTNFGVTWGSGDPIIAVTYTNPLAPSDASSDDPTDPNTIGSVGMNTVFTATNCKRDNTVTSFVKNTAIICDSAPGYGDNQVWTVKITGDSTGEQTSDFSSAFGQTSYISPVVDSVAIQGGALTMATEGNEFVILTGTNMGPVGTQYWGDYGPIRLGGYGYCAGRTTGTGTWCTTTVANTQVTCSTSAGVGTLHAWRLQERKHSTWKTQSRSSVTLDYTAPVLEQIELSPQALSGGGLRTQGGDEVTLTGKGFGSALTNLYPCAAETLPPIGNVYGPAGPQAPRARYGPTGVEFPRRAEANTECSENTESGCGTICIVKSDTEMVCTTEPAVGANHPWTVLVAGQVSTPSSSKTSHRIPVLSIISGTGLRGGGTEGGSTVNIVGDQFGPIPPRNSKGDYSYLIEANYGKWDHSTGTFNTEVVPIFSSNCIMVTPHTALQCITSPGIGKNLTWTITVHAQTAQTSLPNHAEGSYAPPSLYTLENIKGTDVHQGATVGGNHIVIKGKNFGPKGQVWNLPKLTYGKATETGKTKQRFAAEKCAVTKEHVTIECETAQGAGFAHLWEVLVGGQLNTPATTGYTQPVVLNITGPGAHSADTSGNQLVYLHGSDFGPTATSLQKSFLEKVTYGITGREYTAKDCEIVSHSLIKCYTVPGVGTRNLWQVRVAGQLNDVLSSPITDYAVPVCWAILDIKKAALATSTEQWATSPDAATGRIELRCEHTGLADSLASTRYVRYSLGGYERHIDIDSSSTRRIGQPGLPGTYEQIRFINPPLEWKNQPAASVPVTIVMTTASGEILETNALKHTYSAPTIVTKPTVTAGISSVVGTLNVSLTGEWKSII